MMLNQCLTRLIDYLKAKQITALFTNLTHLAGLESTESEVSSIMDTWILLRDIELVENATEESTYSNPEAWLTQTKYVSS